MPKKIRLAKLKPLAKIEDATYDVHLTELQKKLERAQHAYLFTGDRAVIVLEGMETDSFIVADEALLRHVVENLLSNAVKYSPKGSRVCLQVNREGNDIVIQVSDEGIGIPPQDQARLFETFERGSNVGAISGADSALPSPNAPWIYTVAL